MNQKKYVLGLVISIIALAVGVSYAYFTATFQNLGIRETSITLAELGSLKLTASEATYTSGGQYPGDMAVQKFTLEPVSKGSGIYELDLTGVIDESIFADDVEIQLYKSLDNTEVTITEGELTQEGENFSRVDTLVTNGLTPIYTGTLKNGLNLLYQEDFEVVNEIGLKVRENSESTSYPKYTFYLVYNYKNNGNQNIQMGSSFTGTISGKLITEKNLTADDTLAILQELNSNIVLTEPNSVNPNFSRSPEHDEVNTIERYHVYISNPPENEADYITYASGYTYDETTGVYTLVDYQTAYVGDCYNNLTGKYVVFGEWENYYFHSSSEVFYQTDPEYKQRIGRIEYVEYTPSEDPDDNYLGIVEIVISVYIGRSLYEEDNNIWEEQTTGIFPLEDDYGDSYYFRGNIDYNYVKFGKWQTDWYDHIRHDLHSSSGPFTSLSECASSIGSSNCKKLAGAGDDMYWRIVRINGDGTIRMIYDGTQAYNSNSSPEYNGSYYTNVIRSIGTTNYAKTNAYTTIDYMYGNPQSNNYNDAHANINDSAIKTFLDGWYQTQLINYSPHIADGIFCNDRSVASDEFITYLNSLDYLGNTYTNNGYDDNTAYAQYERYIKEFNFQNGNQATFKCPQKNDAFTVSNTTKGNGALTYPVGLITWDEVNIAGYISSDANYLKTGGRIWTMTPETSNMIIYVKDGSGSGSPGNLMGVRPVINLKPGSINAGNGTISNPFRIE